MRINLGGRDVGMAEQSLYHAQIGAVVQQMAGKCVAQDVGTHLLGEQARGDCEFLQLTGRVLPGQVPPLGRYKQPFRLEGGVALVLQRASAALYSRIADFAAALSGTSRSLPP